MGLTQLLLQTETGFGWLWLVCCSRGLLGASDRSRWHPSPPTPGAQPHGPAQPRASTQRSRGRTVPRRHGPAPAARDDIWQRHHRCLVPNRPNNTEAKHRGMSPSLFWRKAKLLQRHGFVLHWLCTLAKVFFFFWPSLSPFLLAPPRLLSVLGATVCPSLRVQNSTLSTTPAPEGGKQGTRAGAADNSASQGHLEKGG